MALDQLTVTPEELETQADAVEATLATMRQSFDRVKIMFETSNQYWVGQAADSHREAYTDYLGRIEEMLNRYGEHVIDLRKMGGVYREAEQTAVKAAETLPASNL